MKLSFLSIFGILIFYSCSTPFLLQTDIYNFPNKLSKKDTLILIMDKSVCISRTVDRSVVTSKGNRIFIQTEISGDYLDKKVLHKTEYKTWQDSLNIEDFLINMDHYGTKARENSNPFITVIHKDDTVQYFSLSLTKKLADAQYYNSIMRRIYPNEKKYQPVKPPEVE